MGLKCNQMMNYYTFYTFATYAYSCLICLLGFFIVLRPISLGADALVATPSGVSKCDFSDNFVFNNSAQIQNFTSWYCRGVNLVDCRVILLRMTSLIKRHQTLISGVTDFAHLNDYIFLANFKL